MTDVQGRAALSQTKTRPRIQYAALPWRDGAGLEILLITSRETGRWVIPKGWPMKGRSPAAAAAAEAREEAGVVGDIAKSPVGSYLYVKFRKTGLGSPCKVKVFPLKVTGQRDSWREQAERTARWFPAAEAAAAVQERQLARLIRKFAKRSAKGAAKTPRPAEESKKTG
jgi:8-oxo-dGTP pyrophosphatase MutT (NUDIX family)